MSPLDEPELPDVAKVKHIILYVSKKFNFYLVFCETHFMNSKIL